MVEKKDIIIPVKALADRINRRTMWRNISASAFWGAGIAVIIISISKFVVIPVQLSFVVALILGLSLLAGIIRGMIARMSPLETAIMIDTKLRLKDRLASAVELLEKTERVSALAELQLEDAGDYARSIDPKAICPYAIPVIAKILPIAGIVLLLLWLVPPRYGEPKEIRQTIKQAGTEIEMTAEEAGKNPLSDEIAKLVSKIALTGRELKKPMTKRSALKNISNVARKVEALRVMSEVNEALKGKMTPEKKRMLNELLEKLSNILRDIPEMEELSQKVIKAQQMDLSDEALKELTMALERKKIKASDMNALQQMSAQLTKSKQDIGQKISMVFRTPAISGGREDEKKEGIASNGSPGKDTAKEPGAKVSRQVIIPDEGYDAELEGLLSEKGKAVTAEIEPKPETGKSVVPYEEIYVKYRDMADDTITRLAIPRIYRDHVKNYFDAIKPKEKSRAGF